MSYIDIHHKKLFRLFYNKKIAVIGNRIHEDSLLAKFNGLGMAIYVTKLNT